MSTELTDDDLKALAVKFREKYGMPVQPTDIGEPEESRRPVWSLQINNALDLEQQARTLRREAKTGRCPAQAMWGAQCTADRHPEHEHRWREEDLP